MENENKKEQEKVEVITVTKLDLAVGMTIMFVAYAVGKKVGYDKGIKDGFVSGYRVGCSDLISKFK